MNNWSMLSRLRNVVKKVKILLNLNLHWWRMVSMIGASLGRRRLSFEDRPGLRACTDDYNQKEDNSDSDSGSGSASFSSSRSPGLHRAISYPSENDIDKRAEMFIANFHKQLQLERQISLKVQYRRANSSERMSP